MRLDAIQTRKAQLSHQIQAFAPEDISGQIVDQFVIAPPPDLKARLKYELAGRVLAFAQPAIRHAIGCPIETKADWLCLGERFGTEASIRELDKRLRHEQVRRVLVPGCYLGREDVQRWLRRGVQQLDGVDVYSLAARWSAIVPELERRFGAKVRFQQASLEQLPFEANSFDVISSAAVFEHVRNLRAAAAETARVLRPGGWASHDFGPLYFTFGGDHCIAAYGNGSGYDHLLLDEASYLARISDQAFFDRQSDSNLPFWARRDQFSFAFAGEYLSAFAEHFDVRHCVVKVCTDALAFRKHYPGKWQTLLEAGLSESDLLTKSIALLLQKRS